MTPWLSTLVFVQRPVQRPVRCSGAGAASSSDQLVDDNAALGKEVLHGSKCSLYRTNTRCGRPGHRKRSLASTAGLLGLLARPYRGWESKCLKRRCWKRSIVPPLQTDSGARSQLTKPTPFLVWRLASAVPPLTPHAYPHTRTTRVRDEFGRMRGRTQRLPLEIKDVGQKKGNWSSEGQLRGTRDRTASCSPFFNPRLVRVRVQGDGYDWDWIG